MTDEAHDPATLSEIADLLSAAEETGLGVSFTPDRDGWTVGYLTAMTGGDLTAAYSLREAAAAALRPLLAEGERRARARADRADD